MENFRSNSTREGSKQICGPPTSMKGLRSYSTSHAACYSSASSTEHNNNNKEMKMKRNKSRVSSSSSSSTSSSSSSSSGFGSRSWSFNDAEVQRKKRVVGYKAYAVEGKMKGSFRKSFRWIKDHLVSAWW